VATGQGPRGKPQKLKWKFCCGLGMGVNLETSMVGKVHVMAKKPAHAEDGKGVIQIKIKNNS